MKSILLVEDDRNTAHAVASRLRSEGHDVCVTHSAWDALAAARGTNFELFILDIGLPDEDGLNLAGQLVSLPGAQATPVLFLTGRTDLNSRLAASKLGVCAWLDKPYKPEELRSAVATALRTGSSDITSRCQFSPLQTLLKRDGKPQSAKVLVIEDDKRLALALERRLKNAGYEVVTAHDGSAGLRAAVESRPSLILSDIYMPGGLGFTIFDHLAERGLTGIPVIFLTASKRPNLRQTALEMGAADFLEKPADPSELLRSIRRSIFSHN